MRRIILLGIATVWTTVVGVGRCHGADIPPAPDIAGLIYQLRDQDQNTRWFVIGKLAKIGSPAIPALSQVLDTTGDEEAKRGALQALAEIPTPESVSAVRKAIKDPDRSVQRSALHSLVALGCDKHVIDRMEPWEPVQAFLCDKDGETRGWAARCLWRMDAQKAVPLLLGTLDREFRMPREKRGMRQNLTRQGWPGEEEVIETCTDLLGGAGWRSIPTIEAYIGKGTKDTDYAIAEVLIRMEYLGPRHVHKELLIQGATKCSSEQVRAECLNTLWRLDDPTTEGILKRALDEPCTKVTRDGNTTYPIQYAARQSLKRLEDRKKGLDPLAEEKASMQKSIDEMKKRDAERHPIAPSSSGQK